MAGQSRTAQPASEVQKPARKAVAKKTAKKATDSAASDSKPAKSPAKKTAKNPTVKKTVPTKKAAAAKRADSSTLSAADRKEFTGLITAELTRVRGEYESSMRILDDLRYAGQDSAGDDPADAGAKTFEREQEMSLANNRLDLIAQMERAMRRIDEGTYGVCESCGELIPKARLQAFPQATLCVACKSREERR